MLPGCLSYRVRFPFELCRVGDLAAPLQVPDRRLPPLFVLRDEIFRDDHRALFLLRGSGSARSFDRPHQGP